jgi:hypothetical protein
MFLNIQNFTESLGINRIRSLAMEKRRLEPSVHLVRATSLKLQLSWSMHALTKGSHRLQAPSSKLQAPSFKKTFDMKDNPGYSINMIRLLIGQCAQAWNLQSILPLKCRGLGRYSGLQAKPFYLFPASQAASHKLQAPSNKLQA